MTAIAAPLPRTKAPLGRLLRSELRMMLRRPRTLVGLGLLASVPVIAGIAIRIAADGEGPVGEGLSTLIEGNGLMLPIFALLAALTMLLPLVGATLAADALAGESTHGTLRSLLVAPVGRARLLAIKAFGVATVTLLACLLMAVTGTITGMVLLGGDGLLTMSATRLPFLDGLGRVLLATVLVAIQIWGIAAVGLAVSAWTDHPLIVLSVALGLLIVSGVLSAIPALDWLDPVLITTGWQSIGEVARDPLPWDTLGEGALRAGCYILIGYSLALSRMLSRDG
ncbi:ABC transporter permease [Actinokineospora sp. NPDC004072]